MKRLIIILAILTAGIGLIYFTASSFLPEISPQTINLETTTEEPSASPKNAYPAPDFTLTDLNGKTVGLNDFSGKIIILNFWTTWNPAAQDQIVILESLYGQIKNDPGVALMAVNNLQNKSLVTNFIRRGGYTLPVLLDEDGKLGELYSITTLPATFFIDKSGRIRDIFIGIINEKEIKERTDKLSL
jgi:peroxiredoxin